MPLRSFESEVCSLPSVERVSAGEVGKVLHIVFGHKTTAWSVSSTTCCSFGASIASMRNNTDPNATQPCSAARSAAIREVSAWATRPDNRVHPEPHTPIIVFIPLSHNQSHSFTLWLIRILFNYKTGLRVQLECLALRHSHCVIRDNDHTTLQFLTKPMSWIRRSATHLLAIADAIHNWITTDSSYAQHHTSVLIAVESRNALFQPELVVRSQFGLIGSPQSQQKARGAHVTVSIRYVGFESDEGEHLWWIGMTTLQNR